MIVDSVHRDVQPVPVTVIVTCVEVRATGEHPVNIRVAIVQLVSNLMVVHLAVILDIICYTTTQKEVMSVNGVMRGLALLFVDQGIGELHVKLDVQIIALSVHLIPRARVV